MQKLNCTSSYVYRYFIIVPIMLQEATYTYAHVTYLLWVKVGFA